MEGDQLRKLRQQIDMTPAELADALDMSPAFLGYLERGIRPIDRRTELAVLYIATVSMRAAFPETEAGGKMLPQL